jgi:hypothetical protein
MRITSVSNPVHSTAGGSTVDCVTSFDNGKTYPYTAAARDDTDYGRQLWVELTAGDHGAISPYAASISPTDLAPG